MLLQLLPSDVDIALQTRLPDLLSDVLAGLDQSNATTMLICGCDYMQQQLLALTTRAASRSCHSTNKLHQPPVSADTCMYVVVSTYVYTAHVCNWISCEVLLYVLSYTATECTRK